MTAAPVRRRQFSTLILNADFQPLSTYPLSIVPAQDAISTLWRDRAYVVENWPDAFYHSPSTTIAIPKVLALKAYAYLSASPKFCRRSILLRDRFSCQYCGGRFPSEELTFDHVVPRSAGGKTTWDNILSACVSCNTMKRNAMPNYSGKKGSALRPLKQPRQPTSAEMLRAGLEFLDPQIRESFGEFLYWNTPLAN